MWLAPAFSRLAHAASRIYYRLTIAGERVPAGGPVLLVANHPNSLIDPILVCAAARRPVRFLAKAPLFSDFKTGWMMRAVGAIPVHRRVDDPGLMDRNQDMFRAVYAGERFVRLGKGTTNVAYVANSNFCDLGVAAHEGTAIVFAAIDNLIKGGAGQAVQCMNIMCGFDEDAGLRMTPGHP